MLIQGCMIMNYNANKDKPDSCNDHDDEIRLPFMCSVNHDLNIQFDGLIPNQFSDTIDQQYHGYSKFSHSISDGRTMMLRDIIKCI